MSNQEAQKIGDIVEKPIHRFGFQRAIFVQQKPTSGFFDTAPGTPLCSNSVPLECPTLYQKSLKRVSTEQK